MYSIPKSVRERRRKKKKERSGRKRRKKKRSQKTTWRPWDEADTRNRRTPHTCPARTHLCFLKRRKVPITMERTTPWRLSRRRIPSPLHAHLSLSHSPHPLRIDRRWWYKKRRTRGRALLGMVVRDEGVRSTPECVFFLRRPPQESWKKNRKKRREMRYCQMPPPHFTPTPF